jgi:hypothetical protein
MEKRVERNRNPEDKQSIRRKLKAACRKSKEVLTEVLRHIGKSTDGYTYW